MSKEKNKGNDILIAATKIFCDKGFGKTNISEIADIAGVGKGTVYEYFRSKEELFLHVVEYYKEEYISRLKERMEESNSFQDKIDQFIDFNREVVEIKMKHIELITKGSGGSLPDTTRESFKIIIKTLHQEVIKILMDVLSIGETEGILRPFNKGLAADMFFEMTMRHCFRIITGKYDAKHVAKEKQELIELFINGVGFRGECN